MVIQRLKTLIVSTGADQWGLLYKLADMVARTLKFDRLPGEPGEKFLTRLAGHLEEMPANQRLVAEMRTGMTATGINLVDLARALRDPSGPLAARLAARAEASLLNSRTGSADAVTLSYLDDGAGEHHSTETAQAQKAARASADGQNLFAPHVKDAAGADTHPPDARLLQNMLTRAYREDAQGGMAIQAQTTEMAVEQGAGISRPKGPVQLVADRPAGSQGKTEQPPGLGETFSASGMQAIAGTKDTEAGSANRSKGADDGANGQREALDHRPTMLILRGLSEVVSQFTDRAAATFRAVIDAPTDAKPFPTLLVDHQTPPGVDPRPGTRSEIAGKELRKQPVTAPDQTVMARLPFEDAATPAAAGLSSAIRADAERPMAANPLSSDREALQQVFREPLPVPYAAIPYPVEDEPEKAARHASKNRDDDDKDRGSKKDDDDQGQHEGRKRPDEAPAADESDDGEEMPTLSRSATDAERAYHHYQRMRGF
jgi:hypothetical protein